MSGPDGGPPDKWTKFKSENLTSDEVLAALDMAAKEGFKGGAFEKLCVDGLFIFVAGYSD